jgi:hypothetical protein
MIGSAIVYSGIILALAGLILVMKPIRRLGVPTRARAAAIVGVGALVVVVGLVLPARESRVARARTRLDELTPVWQFRERHTLKVAAPPARVFDAIRRVRADEIALFNTLTWIRRGGRQLPEGILNAGKTESLIDVALRGGFVRLADDSIRELVVGTVVVAPPATRGVLRPETFLNPLPPGFALATMNLLVEPDGPHASVVSTETRVFANSPAARRRFAAYWRVIYPGSAIIRRMWLRAIARRATRV